MNRHIIYKFFFLTLALLVLSACATLQASPTPTPSPLPPPDPKSEEAARQTLVLFFNLLNSGKYGEAEYYFPTYQHYNMWQKNSDLDMDPVKPEAQWKAACEGGGFQCLTVRSAVVKEHYGDTYLFTVEFNNPDGSLFVKGTEQPPVSQFEYHVSWLDEDGDPRFLIDQLPVYVP